MNNFSELVGKTLTNVLVDNYEDTITFVLNSGEEYSLYHDQDCCEDVNIEDVNGDLMDLVNTPILVAEERTSEDDSAECGMWTFYTLRTIKGSVDIRWYGSSSGYYSVSVSFGKVK